MHLTQIEDIAQVMIDLTRQNRVDWKAKGTKTFITKHEGMDIELTNGSESNFMQLKLIQNGETVLNHRFINPEERLNYRRLYELAAQIRNQIL